MHVDLVLYLRFFFYILFSLGGGAELMVQEGRYTFSVLFSFYALKKRKEKKRKWLPPLPEHWGGQTFADREMML